MLTNQNQRRYQATKRVSLISAAVNTLLAIFKIIVGIIGHSYALVADGIHSFSDLLSDALVVVATRLAGARPDREHPYGHQRIETIATMMIAIMLFAVGGSIIYEGIQHWLQTTSAPTPSGMVLVIAAISVLANEGLYRYTLAVGKKLSSNLLISNAWHNRSDALVSIIVFISALGGLLGYHHLDTLGAIVIAFFILKMGITLLWNGVCELIDTGVDKTTLDQIHHCITHTPGVREIHQLRTRLHSHHIFVDVHILVDPFISVSEGHFISEQVHLNLMRRDKRIHDVTVHIDPEDDEVKRPCQHLPNRQAVLTALKPHWESLENYNQITKIQLHYLDGKLYIDLFMATSSANNSEHQLTNLRASLREAYHQAAKQQFDTILERVTIYYE